MTGVLGYPRYGAHGGDIGAMVTNRLAVEHPGAVAGIHVTMPAEPAAGPDTLTDEENAFLARRRIAQEAGGGYSHLQRTRPDTLAVALNDSPAGLAAWLADKWHDWSDGHRVDDLLTAVTIYWVPGTIGTSFAVYRDWALGSAGRPEAWADPAIPSGVDSKPPAPGEGLPVPAAVALFEQPVPVSWVRRAYADLRRCERMPRGGHFPALAATDVLAADLRDFFGSVRG